MPLTVEQFTKRLTESGILPDEQFQEFFASLSEQSPARSNSEELARELVRQTKLTKFQAEQIYQGKGESLVLGNYIILDKLGQGGMGMVLKAEHKRMKRLVAIKVMSPSAVKTPDALKRFHREVEAAAKLRHPNIVAADDADEAKGTHFLVMEYVEGSDLSVLVKKNGPFPVDQAVRCIIQAARGLEFAHKRGVVHRDIKPANLLLDREGTVKILDMGLARIDDSVGGSSEGAGLTSTGTIMGTVDYMSPEQAMDTKQADARSDIYSLGCSLYYLLTGRSLFDGDTIMKKLIAHREGAIPDLESRPVDRQQESRTSVEAGSPSRVDGAALKAINAVFHRMVAKKPQDRPKSMTEVIADLERCLSGDAATVTIERSSITSANSAASSAVSTNELQSFSRPIGGSESQTDALGRASGTAVSPSSFEAATMISSAGDVLTDPGTVKAPSFDRANQPINIKTRATQSHPSRSRMTLLIGSVAAVVALLVAVIFVMKGEPKADRKQETASTSIRETDAATTSTDYGRTPPENLLPKPAVAPFDANKARGYQEAWAKHLGVPVEYTNSIGMKFRLIPPGEFTMGSTREEIEATLKGIDEKLIQECIKSEAPQHKVILTQPIYLGVNEVTQAEYEKVMGSNPSHFAATGRGKEAVAGKETASHPVEMVSWNDAAEFCAKLSKQEKLKPFYFRAGETITPLDGTGYRLPSEAEWEFAGRAGTVTKYWTGDQSDDLMRGGWFNGNSGGRTHAAGELKANPFGLTDIHGNVWEWVQDGWDASYYGQFLEKTATNPNSPFSSGSKRVIRGGDWFDTASGCRSSSRSPGIPTDRYFRIGFRVSLLVESVKQRLAEKAATTPSPAVAPFDANQALAHQEAWAKHLGVPVEYTNSIGMKFRLIPPGEFLMGSIPAEIEAALKDVPDDSNSRWIRKMIQSESPRHKVVLSQPIYLGTYEVTQAEYEKVMGKNPSHYNRQNGNEAVAGMDTTRFPVDNVSWNDAAECCAKLSLLEGHKPFYKREGENVVPLDGTGYQLPTEAEWEFACRAGTMSKFWSGDRNEDLAKAGWFRNNASGRTHRVGDLQANPFGLYDVHGNSWEWVRDGWRGEDPSYGAYADKPEIDPYRPFVGSSDRMLRGGFWFHPASGCGSSSRHAFVPSAQSPNIGFRMSLSIEAVKKRSTIPQAANSPGKLNAPNPAVAPFDARQARGHQEEWARHLGVPVEYTNLIGMKFRLIPPGEFMMGSTPEEIEATLNQIRQEDTAWRDRAKSEGPQHLVRLTRPIYLGTTEVTQGQYESVIGKNPSHFSATGPGRKLMSGLDTTSHPVETVSWHEVIEFCSKLGQREKLTGSLPHRTDSSGQPSTDAYGLPTEAEWEFACRAGTTTSHWTGNDEASLARGARFGDQVELRTYPVGTLEANPFGLFDMHGNVWEWVRDGWSQNYYEQLKDQPTIDPLGVQSPGAMRVQRGGASRLHAMHCRSSNRGSVPPDARLNGWGFRVALSVEAVQKKLSEPEETTALQFDGSGARVEIPSLVMEPTRPITIEVWARPSKPVNHGVVAGFAGQCVLRLRARQWWFGVRDKDSKIHEVVASSDVDWNKPAHVAGVYDGKHVRLFVDGIRHGEPVPCSSVVAVNWMATLGAAFDGTDPFAGEVSQARFSQVARYVDDFDPPARFTSDKDTLALYLFQEGAGTSMKDESGHMHNGKIVNAGWISNGTDKKLGAQTTSSRANPDRVAAEWVITQGGEVALIGRQGMIASVNDLPADNFEIRHIKFKRRLFGEDADLVPLRALNHLEFVGIDYTHPTPAGITALAQLPKLERVSCGGQPLSDDQVTALTRLNKITSLYLAGAQLKPAQCAILAGSMTQVGSLNLMNNPLLDDTALTSLARMSKLAKLQLQGTKVTAAGVAALQQALPNCLIEWDNPDRLK